jgi:hypothetical protein
MSSSLGMLFGHHHDLVNRYGIAVLQMTKYMLFVVHDYHRFGSNSSTMDAIYGTGTPYSRQAPEFTPSFR